METTNLNLKKKINPEWKEFLKKYITQQDIARVSLENEMGYHSLHGIKMGSLNISTEKNKKALEALIKVSIENAESKLIEVQSDVESMKANNGIIHILNSSGNTYL